MNIGLLAQARTLQIFFAASSEGHVIPHELRHCILVRYFTDFDNRIERV
jgi:hypothetical protein